LLRQNPTFSGLSPTRLGGLVGELRIECLESISAAILWSKLRAQNLDLALREGWPLEGLPHCGDLNIETLFDDGLPVAAGHQSRWARRRKIDFAELAEEKRILTSGDTWNYQVIANAFATESRHENSYCAPTRQSRVRRNLRATNVLPG
jgi:hypothetical protein